MKSVRKLAAAALTGAAYAALTILTAPISYGAVQMRISEVLCVLPFFIPCTGWGLFAGCIISNLFSAAGLLDVIFGPLATLLAALCMSMLGRRGRLSMTAAALACAMPVVFNGVIVGGVLAKALADLRAWPLFGLQVAAGEAVVLYAAGLPLLRLMLRTPVFRRLAEQINGAPLVDKHPET